MPDVFAGTIHAFTGFEHGDRELKGTAGSPVFDTSPVRTGAHSLHITAAGNAACAAYIGVPDSNGQQNGSAGTACTASFYVYLTSYPSGTVTFAWFAVAGTHQGQYKLKSDGKVEFYNRLGSLVATSTDVIALNRWVRIDISRQTTAPRAMLQIDYVNQWADPGVIDVGTSAINELRMGRTTTGEAAAISIWFDDVAWCTGGWIDEDFSVTAMDPKMDSTSGGFFGIGCTPGYTYSSDPNMYATVQGFVATYPSLTCASEAGAAVGTNNSGGGGSGFWRGVIETRAEAGLDTIMAHAVQYFAVGRKRSASSGDGQLFGYGQTGSTSTAQVAFPGSQNWEARFIIAQSSIDTAGDWAIAELDTLSVGFKGFPGGGSQQVHLVQARVAVLHATEHAPVVLAEFSPWPFEPDAGQPFVEEYGYLTGLLYADTAAEQAWALRQKPEGSLAFSYLLDAREAALAHALLFNNQGGLWGVPLWQYKTALTAAASAGATEIFVPTASTPYAVDALLFIWRDAFTWETHPIQSIASNKVTISEPLGGSFALAGSFAMPMVTGRLPQQQALSLLSRGAAAADLIFAVEAFLP